MDSRLRELERTQQWPAYWRAVARADLFHDYGVQLGPLSLLEAKCANEECEARLAWSNCSFCDWHHNLGCIWDGDVQAAAAINKDDVIIESVDNKSCNHGLGIAAP